jgi:hypothetical protein
MYRGKDGKSRVAYKKRSRIAVSWGFMAYGEAGYKAETKKLS